MAGGETAAGITGITEVVEAGRHIPWRREREYGIAGDGGVERGRRGDLCTW